MPLPASLAVLRERPFVLYLAARLLGAFAVQMQSVAIGWQVYALSGELLHLGLVGLAQFLPFLILILPAGQAADRLNRRRIITACLGVNLLCALLLWGMTAQGSARSGRCWPCWPSSARRGPSACRPARRC